MKSRQSAMKLFSHVLCAALGAALFAFPALSSLVVGTLSPYNELEEVVFWADSSVRYGFRQIPSESNGYTAICDVDLAYFQGASVDGNWLSPGVDYSSSRGGTVVTLFEGLIRRLSPGSHSLQLYFDGGDVYANFTVPFYYGYYNYDLYQNGVVYVVPETRYLRSYYYDNPANITLGNVGGIEQVFTEDMDSLAGQEETDESEESLVAEIDVVQVSENVEEQAVSAEEVGASDVKEAVAESGDSREDGPDVSPASTPSVTKTATQGQLLWLLLPICVAALVMAMTVRKKAPTNGTEAAPGHSRRKHRSHRHY